MVDVLAIEDEELDLLIFDLDPNHNQYVYSSVLFFGKVEVPDSTPNWTIVAFLKGAEFADDVTSVSFKKIDGQFVGILEVAVSLGEDESVFGKIFLFIRNGKIVSLAGATDNYEWLPDVNNTMDSILDSFDFDIKN